MRLPRLPRFRLLPASQPDDNSCHSLLISLLRGLAALQVAAAHLRNESMPSLRSLDEPAAWYVALALLTGFAHQAVVLFFLISGWLVGGSLLNKIGQPQALRLYAIDRISRLWTVLIPTFGLIVALGILTGAVDPRSIDFSPSNPYSWTSLAGNLAGLQTVSVPQFGANYPLWSLANESWYYLMFPPLLLFLQGRHRLPAALALLLAAVLLPFDILLYFTIWLLGAAFSRIRLDCGAPTRIALLLLLVSLSGYFRLKGSNDDLTAGSYGQDLLLSLVFLALLSSTVTPVNPRFPLIAPLRRGANFLSSFSFTLYVVHVPLIGMLRWLGLHLFGRQGLRADGVGNLAAYLGLLALVLALSYGFYWLFEARTGQVRRILKKRLAPRPSRPGLRAM